MAVAEENVWVDVEGRPVPHADPRAVRLALAVGDEIPEGFGKKSSAPAADKSSSPETDKGLAGQSSKSVAEVLTWVGDDPEKAREALAAERIGRNRKSLIAELEDLQSPAEGEGSYVEGEG